mgnify:CR=1 FL=1
MPFTQRKLVKLARDISLNLMEYYNFIDCLYRGEEYKPKYSGMTFEEYFKEIKWGERTKARIYFSIRGRDVESVIHDYYNYILRTHGIEDLFNVKMEEIRRQAARMGIKVFGDGNYTRFIGIVSSHIGKEQIDQTFIHEATHSCLDLLGEHTLSSNEKFVSAYSNLIHQLIDQI